MQPDQAFEPGAFKTLIQNLVGNAITHTPQGTRIVLSIEANERDWCLGIDDSGPGVSEQDRARLADRFFSRGDTHGTGLGLSIVQRIVQRHQGVLTMDTSKLGGLQVKICFPVSQIHNDDTQASQTGIIKTAGSV